MAKSILPRDSLLAILPTELLHSLFAKAGAVSLVADQILFSAGDEGDGCYLVDEGLLKASITTSTGGEYIVAIFGSELGCRRIVHGRWRTALDFGYRTA